MEVKLYKNKGGEVYDITDAIDGVTWGGDYQQVSRTLSFSIIYPTLDKNNPKANIEVGDKITFKDYNLELFRGIVWDKTIDTSNQFISINCYDSLIYMTKSQVAKIYTNLTPEAVTRQVCSEFNVPVGYLAGGGSSRNYIALGTSPYEVIQAAYTHASKQNGQKYMPRMMNGKLHVIQKGVSQANVILDGKYNLENAKYGQSLEGMVNKVIVYKSEDGSEVLVEKRDDLINAYGIIQQALNYEEEKDNKELAKKQLKDIDRTAEVKALGHPMCIAGNIVYVKDDHTSLIGKFYIDSDNHTWNKGIHSMSLTLNFENLMDEKELETELQKQDDSNSDDSNSDSNSDSDSKSDSGYNSDWTMEHTDCAGHGVNPE